jgi:hypothetical protein
MVFRRRSLTGLFAGLALPAAAQTSCAATSASSGKPDASSMSPMIPSAASQRRSSTSATAPAHHQAKREVVGVECRPWPLTICAVCGTPVGT